MRAVSIDKQDRFDFDRHAVRQGAHADGRSGVVARLTEGFREQIGAAIDDLRMPCKIRLCVDHAE